MSWPAHIVAKSSRVLDAETIENKFYGLYNSILTECFPSTQFTVTPQYVTEGAQTGGSGTIGFTIAYVVELLDLGPIFFIEIRPPTEFSSLSARRDANDQVRTRFRELADILQIPKLYGVSAFGR